MIYVITFLSWTFLFYLMHRAAHILPFMRKYHMDHHKQVTQQTVQGLNWKNFFLYFDSWESTCDQWLTEVIPTLLFCIVTNQWWIAVFYYIWAGYIQEAIEHNDKINLYPFLTSGRWHLIHHDDPNKNYGVFFPIWDMLFKTWKPLDGNEKSVVENKH
jgi:sterol desaturase/sphingolipid hydroxylase (fatty acid hydroxylase superfamily)